MKRAIISLQAMWKHYFYRSIPGGYVRQQGGPWLIHVSVTIPWVCPWRAREKEQKRKTHNWIILPRNVNFNADKTLLLWLLASDAPTSPLQKFALFTIHLSWFQSSLKSICICCFLSSLLHSLKIFIIGVLMAPSSVFECRRVVLKNSDRWVCGANATLSTQQNLKRTNEELWPGRHPFA